MSTPVIERPAERPAATPRDPWGSAPVAVGHHRRRLGWGLLVLVLICAGALVVLRGRTGPITSPTTPSTSAPARAPDPTSVPFDVTVHVAEVASMNNDGMFGEEVPLLQPTVDTAIRQIDEVLQRYLSDQFVTAETRFSVQPLADLLTQQAMAAMSDDDLAGLGALGISVQQVRAAPVTATARVLTIDSQAVLVAVRYDARAQVLTDDSRSLLLHQHTTMVFVPHEGGWRAEAVDAVLDLMPPSGEVAR